MSTFATANTTVMPYGNAYQAWRFVNYIHLLARQSSHAGLRLTPTTGITLDTLRQKISGGRWYILHHPPEEDLAAFVDIAPFVLTRKDPPSVKLLQKEGFKFYHSEKELQQHPYISALTVIDSFAMSEAQTLVHPLTSFSPGAQAALKDYIAMRPNLRNCLVSSTFAKLSK